MVQDMSRLSKSAPLLAICVMSGCYGADVPAREPDARVKQPFYQTVDGKRFATEAERSAYLQNTAEARRERELIALEQTRQERIATDLGALQRQRQRLRADAALAEAEAADREATQLRRETGFQDRDSAAILEAERREDEARRAEKLARQRAGAEPFQAGRAPWQRLIRYRRDGEALPAFRRRVVAAIGKARRSGAQVEDYL